MFLYVTACLLLHAIAALIARADEAVICAAAANVDIAVCAAMSCVFDAQFERFQARHDFRVVQFGAPAVATAICAAAAAAAAALPPCCTSLCLVR